MATPHRVPQMFFILALAGLLTACSLGSRDPEIVVIPLPTSTGLPTSTSEQSDACLAGPWVMPTHSLDLLVATLFPSTSSFMRITAGQLTMTFADGAYTYAGDYLMHVDSGPGQYSEAQSTFSTAGAYATQDSRILFEVSSSESRMVSCSAYKDGAVYTVPCDSIASFSLLPPADAPYRCTADRLEIDTLAPSGMVVTMFFER